MRGAFIDGLAFTVDLKFTENPLCMRAGSWAISAAYAHLDQKISFL